jgi:lipopolysaccharide export LptBFGC system permease protein LptF
LSLRLTGYIVLLTLARCAGALVILTLLYVSVDMVEATSAARASALDVLGAYAFKLPTVVSHVLPMAVAFGALITLSYLRRFGEWDALRLAGLSPLRLAAALLLVPAMSAALAMANAGSWAPAAMRRYEEIAGWAPPDRGDRGRWSRDGDRLVRVGGGAGGLLVVERDRSGAATGWSRGSEGGRGLGWEEGRGWSALGRPLEAPEGGVVAPRVEAWSGGLAGQALSSDGIAALATELEGRGLDAGPLRAQLSLRFALAAACLIVPAIGLLLALNGTSHRASRMVLTGLAASAFYWLAVVVAWNGAIWGAWSERVLGVGVPLMGLAAAIAAGLVAALSGRSA